jgi:hypothetical protein
MSCGQCRQADTCIIIHLAETGGESAQLGRSLFACSDPRQFGHGSRASRDRAGIGLATDLMQTFVCSARTMPAAREAASTNPTSPTAPALRPIGRWPVP